MSEAHEAPQGGALSIDQAVALLDRREDEESDAPERSGWDEDFEGAASAPEEAADRAEDPSDGDEETEAEDAGEVDRLEPPKYWSKDAKARFAELDPDLQAVVLSQEGPREEAAAKAKAEARAARQSAEAHIGQLEQIGEALKRHLAQAEQAFAAQWGGTPDWAAIAQAYGPEAAEQAHAQHQAQRAQIAQSTQAARIAEHVGHQAYVAAEFERLKELEPELADAKAGADRRTEITRYLHGKGVHPQSLMRISALELSLARKAMLWDQAQAKAGTSAATPRPAPQATRPLTRGGASSGAVDPKARRAAQARSRFAKSRSLEDAVALLNAQGD